jgi:prepilin-type N-terminal cleavage/methylation domain-containing protein
MRSRRAAGFTLLELMIVVAIVGILSATAVPSFLHYMAKARSAEARIQIEKLYNAARVYWLEPHGASGSILPLPPQFPASRAATPGVRCCVLGGGPGGRCAPDSTEWQDPTWVGLNFSMDDPHYYQYEFVSSGAEFTARAVGDLDCDGDLSSFSMVGRVDPANGVFGLAAIHRVDELE